METCYSKITLQRGMAELAELIMSTTWEKPV